jgi:penicillin amidase
MLTGLAAKRITRSTMAMANPPFAVPPRRSLGRRLAVVALALGLVCPALAAGIVWRLEARVEGAVPPLDGAYRVQGLGASVQIERDSLGVPTLHAENRVDLALATGFVHGQDRFFQMDLFRRLAAGELAELVGPAALDQDKAARKHSFRTVTQRRLASLPTEDRLLLEAYARGVEAGRRSAKRDPFEYMLLGQDPMPWQAEDTLLVVLGMFRLLNGGAVEREKTTEKLFDGLPNQLAQFLSPPGSSWDAPLDDSQFPFPALPTAKTIDLRKQSHSKNLSRECAAEAAKSLGSNAWAIAGSNSAHGGAILANDMHLPLSAPGVWYRAAFHWTGSDGRDHRAFGVTLPGAPAMVVGSNTHVAWGFTNLEGDFADLVVLKIDPANKKVYRTPDGDKRFERRRETIRVKGRPDTIVHYDWTVWGPVWDKDRNGRKRALCWVAHKPDALNLQGLGLETAQTVDQALAIANRSGQPAQNFLTADARGNIAWTVLGRLPRRVGFDGQRPVSWADGKSRWEGWVKPAEYPRIIMPVEGRLWSANNRPIGLPNGKKLGLGNFDLGARAGQIRDGLRQNRKLTEADMLAIQLDNRALFLARWQKLLLSLLQKTTDSHRLALRDAVAQWGGRADPDSVGFRVVRRFRQRMRWMVLHALTEPARDKKIVIPLHHLDPNVEDSVWQVLAQRPIHLIPPPHATWDAAFASALDAVCQSIQGNEASFDTALATYTWGAENTPRIRHPFASLNSILTHWLNLEMPIRPLPGDWNNMPRIQAESAGASQRMVVSPGREAEGYFHMPAGQSGHPRSPHFQDGHSAWAEGKQTPFLPGPPVHTLVLEPG